MANGWITSTPPAEKKYEFEVSVKIHDGTALYNIKISSKMKLQDLINEAVSITCGRSTFDQIGYLWSPKSGRKADPEYLDTQEQLEALFERIRRHQETEKKKKRGKEDLGIIIKNLGTQVCLLFSFLPFSDFYL